MAYAAWSVIAGEQPTAAKWNILGTNDSSFNDGTGIGTNAVAAASLATSAIKLGYASSTTPQTGITTEVDATSLSVTFTNPAGGRDVLVFGNVNIANSSAGALLTLRMKEGATLLRTYTIGVYNTTNVNTYTYFHKVAAPSAGSHTYKLTAQFSTGSGQLYGDGPTDYINDMLVAAI